MTVEDILETVCNKRQLLISDCYIRIRAANCTEYTIPELHSVFNQLVSVIE